VGLLTEIGVDEPAVYIGPHLFLDRAAMLRRLGTCSFALESYLKRMYHHG